MSGLQDTGAVWQGGSQASVPSRSVCSVSPQFLGTCLLLAKPPLDTWVLGPNRCCPKAELSGCREGRRASYCRSCQNRSAVKFYAQVLLKILLEKDPETEENWDLRTSGRGRALDLGLLMCGFFQTQAAAGASDSTSLKCRGPFTRLGLGGL